MNQKQSKEHFMILMFNEIFPSKMKAYLAQIFRNKKDLADDHYQVISIFEFFDLK